MRLFPTLGSSGSSSQSSQKVSLLEMKALSAEQKAELAEQKLKQSLTTQSQLEGRNTQLEQHFEEVSDLEYVFYLSAGVACTNCLRRLPQNVF